MVDHRVMPIEQTVKNQEDPLNSISIKKKKDRPLKFKDKKYETNLQQTFGHTCLNNHKFDDSEESDKKETPIDSSDLKEKKIKKSKKKKQNSQVKLSYGRKPKSELRSINKNLTFKIKLLRKKIQSLLERIQADI